MHRTQSGLWDCGVSSSVALQRLTLSVLGWETFVTTTGSAPQGGGSMCRYCHSLSGCRLVIPWWQWECRTPGENVWCVVVWSHSQWQGSEGSIIWKYYLTLTLEKAAGPQTWFKNRSGGSEMLWSIGLCRTATALCISYSPLTTTFYRYLVTPNGEAETEFMCSEFLCLCGH